MRTAYELLTQQLLFNNISFQVSFLYTYANYMFSIFNCTNFVNGNKECKIKLYQTIQERERDYFWRVN